MECYNNRISRFNPETKPLKIIFDSNAFFVQLQFKIDIFEELKTLLNLKFEPIVLSSIRKELEKLAKDAAPKKRKNAIYALHLAERCKVVETNKQSGSADDAIIKMAREWKTPVFTNDKQLRKRLRDINVPVIYVRRKALLEIDGRI